MARRQPLRELGPDDTSRLVYIAQIARHGPRVRAEIDKIQKLLDEPFAKEVADAIKLGQDVVTGIKVSAAAKGMAQELVDWVHQKPDWMPSRPEVVTNLRVDTRPNLQRR